MELQPVLLTASVVTLTLTALYGSIWLDFSAAPSRNPKVRQPALSDQANQPEAQGAAARPFRPSKPWTGKLS